MIDDCCEGNCDCNDLAGADDAPPTRDGRPLMGGTALDADAVGGATRANDNDGTAALAVFGARAADDEDDGYGGLLEYSRLPIPGDIVPVVLAGGYADDDDDDGGRDDGAIREPLPLPFPPVDDDDDVRA